MPCLIKTLDKYESIDYHINRQHDTFAQTYAANFLRNQDLENNVI